MHHELVARLQPGLDLHLHSSEFQEADAREFSECFCCPDNREARIAFRDNDCFGGLVRSFTLYSTAVIATSQKVLHSQLRAGLITQQVTNL